MKKFTQNVNKDKLLNDLPKVRPDFSKWLNRHTNYQACNLGQIVPIYYQEVLPGEKKKIIMAMTSHTTTPEAPIFPSLYTEIRVFAVPLRLCADLLNGYKTRKSPWVKVFGEDNENTDSTIIVPLDEQALPSFTVNHQFIQDFLIWEGGNDAPSDNIFDSLDLIDVAGGDFYTKNNFLNFAAYELIYQRHYRNENYESATASPLYRWLFDAYNENKAAVTIPLDYSFEYANREKDYFTGMKPFTQKGDPVRVSVGDEAEVLFKNSQPGVTVGTASSIGLRNITTMQAGQTSKIQGTPSGSNAQLSLIADLKSAQGVSIEELRLLVKTQELLEKDAMYGTLYAQSLNAHFGCCPLDLTLQDPQELYKTTITSQMQAIFQTSTTKDEVSILGTIGANSTTQTDPFVILPETEFKEHCILMICAVHKLQNVYDSTYFKPKFNFKKARFDFYTPELNDLGFQPVSKDEMRSNSSAVAGYNEAFAEYRYVFNKSHGSLNDQFKYWAPAISNEYGSAATLYKEGEEILDKALSVTSINAPQFYDAWGFEEENTKPMSLHSIPGMDGVI